MALALAAAVLLGTTGGARAATLQVGYAERAVYSGLIQPTKIQFAPDGRVFVAEKAGVIKRFDSLSDPTPTVVADLRTEVFDFFNAGLLGMALDPNFTKYPYIYVLYAYDAPIGGTAPTWGDTCPDFDGGCVFSGRLARIEADTGHEDVLINDWCHQYPLHTVDDLAFDSTGWLYASAGDGAGQNGIDYGQRGDPPNPCGDPPGGVGGTQSPPSAEGGALRAQDLRTGGDPASLDGSVIRVDPRDGSALEDNPNGDEPDANARRIVAYGLRNPFRIAFRPGTHDLWIGDVGEATYEELHRHPTNVERNFGWPCYEGPGHLQPYDAANLTICETLYPLHATSLPYYVYQHSQKVVLGEACPTGSSALSGLAFKRGTAYPDTLNNALFFSDFVRRCIWAMKATGGIPDPSKLITFESGAGSPVDLQFGPDGNLYYADIVNGKIKRIINNNRNHAPAAVPKASPSSGPSPLTVAFDGRQSSDPDGNPITYAWDLDGDGSYDDSNSATPTYTYTQLGDHWASLRVTDSQGATGKGAVSMNVGNRPPIPTIALPNSGLDWVVGQRIDFTGSATDPEDGSLPASALSWRATLEHCPSACHTHLVDTFAGVGSGSFTAPDHGFPSDLLVRLTATDSRGLQASTTLRLDARTVDLTLVASPSGPSLTLNDATIKAPFARTVIEGSRNTISAPASQKVGNTTYFFMRWSDGGTRTHKVTASATETLTAMFTTVP